MMKLITRMIDAMSSFGSSDYGYGGLIYNSNEMKPSAHYNTYRDRWHTRRYGWRRMHEPARNNLWGMHNG